MPSVLPRTSKERSADFCHRPAWVPSLRVDTRRSSITISPITSSATERVLENGALNTGTPPALAARKSTWLVPTLKQPTSIRVLARANTSAVSCVRERMPRMCTPSKAASSAAPSSDCLTRRISL